MGKKAALLAVALAVAGLCILLWPVVSGHMYYNASRKGSIETMPDTPGLAVWKSGHIGVYIGNGEVIEAMDTRYGVVKTKLQGRGWTHWLEVPGIKYD